MTLKQLIKLENNAREVWVISPTLHYDTEHKDFSELVSVNLGESTKYRYIVPATPVVEKNIARYKQRYKLAEADIHRQFLILPPAEFNAFLPEIAIYDASGDCVAVAAPALDDSDEVIRYKPETSRALARHFAALWKKYKRAKP
jgi:hypothetical protein